MKTSSYLAVRISLYPDLFLDHARHMVVAFAREARFRFEANFHHAYERHLEKIYHAYNVIYKPGRIRSFLL